MCYILYIIYDIIFYCSILYYNYIFYPIILHYINYIIIDVYFKRIIYIYTKYLFYKIRRQRRASKARFAASSRQASSLQAPGLQPPASNPSVSKPQSCRFGASKSSKCSNLRACNPWILQISLLSSFQTTKTPPLGPPNWICFRAATKHNAKRPPSYKQWPQSSKRCPTNVQKGLPTAAQ